MIVAHVAVLPDQTLGQLLGHPGARGPQVVRILQDVAISENNMSVINNNNPPPTCHPCGGYWAASSVVGLPRPCSLSSTSEHSSHPVGCN